MSYYQRNRDRLLKYQKQYNKENKETVLTYQKIYYEVYLGIRYTELIPFLIASIKELKQQITQQNTIITTLQATSIAQQIQIAQITSRLNNP
jgi:hypothetical protein